MQNMICDLCGWVYSPAEGIPEDDIAAGTSFDALADDFVCPVCGAGKDDFSPED